MDNLVCPIRNALQQDLLANLLRSYLLPHPHGNFSPASQLALLRCGGIPAEAIPTMTDLLTVPHNIGRIIVEDGPRSAVRCWALIVSYNSAVTAA